LFGRVHGWRNGGRPKKDGLISSGQNTKTEVPTDGGATKDVRWKQMEDILELVNCITEALKKEKEEEDCGMQR